MEQSKNVGPLEAGLARLIMGSRWLQAPLYVGLIVVLGVVVVKFPFKLWELMKKAATAPESDLVLAPPADTA